MVCSRDWKKPSGSGVGEMREKMVGQEFGEVGGGQSMNVLSVFIFYYVFCSVMSSFFKTTGGHGRVLRVLSRFPPHQDHCGYSGEKRLKGVESVS